MAKQQLSIDDKVKLVKNIYNQALTDIYQIKKERDKKINGLLKTIDAKHIAKATKDIKDLQ